MKIPKKINILGFEYKIIQKETESMMRNSWWGMVSPTTQQINIRPDIPENYKLNTLLHEIIHAIDFITKGSGDYGLTEEQTEQIATGFVTVLRNNKVEQWL